MHKVELSFMRCAPIPDSEISPRSNNQKDYRINAYQLSQIRNAFFKFILVVVGFMNATET